MSQQRRIRIEVGGMTLYAVLNESRTAHELWEVLPVTGRGSFWGKEIYFDVGCLLSPTNPDPAVDVGAVAYWAPGTSLCLFWGPTPASTDERPMAASPVTVAGRLEDPLALESVSDIDWIVVSRDEAS